MKKVIHATFLIVSVIIILVASVLLMLYQCIELENKRIKALKKALHSRWIMMEESYHRHYEK